MSLRFLMAGMGRQQDWPCASLRSRGFRVRIDRWGRASILGHLRMALTHCSGLVGKFPSRAIAAGSYDRLLDLNSNHNCLCLHCHLGRHSHCYQSVRSCFAFEVDSRTFHSSLDCSFLAGFLAGSQCRNSPCLRTVAADLRHNLSYCSTHRDCNCCSLGHSSILSCQRTTAAVAGHCNLNFDCQDLPSKCSCVDYCHQVLQRVQAQVRNHRPAAFPVRVLVRSWSS